MRGTTLISDSLRLAAVAGLLVLCSCAKTGVVEGRTSAYAGNQGGAWEMIVGTPAAPPEEGWEFARLDHAMSIRETIEEPRPLLDDLRRLYLISDPDVVYYYRTPWYRRRH